MCVLARTLLTFRINAAEASGFTRSFLNFNQGKLISEHNAWCNNGRVTALQRLAAFAVLQDDGMLRWSGGNNVQTESSTESMHDSSLGSVAQRVCGWAKAMVNIKIK